MAQQLECWDVSIIGQQRLGTVLALCLKPDLHVDLATWQGVDLGKVAVVQPVVGILATLLSSRKAGKHIGLQVDGGSANQYSK